MPLLVGLVLGNFFYAWMADASYWVALDRSFSQAVAIGLYAWFYRKPASHEDSQ